jgi:cytochrome c biogenesis protein CcdA
MNKGLFLLSIVFLISLTSVLAENSTDIVVFYGDGCPHCADLEVFLEDIKDEYNLNIISYEVYSDESNRHLATVMAEEYGESFRGVPMTFVGDDVFIGFSDKIGGEIEEKIKECIDECCDSPFDKVKSCEIKEDKKERLTLGAIVALAVADSINPCALAVLAMALIALLAKDPSKKKNVLLGGLAFTSAVFITYLIYGGIIIQFFKALESYFVSISIYVRILFAIVAILIGLMNLKDFFKYKPGSFATEMPIKMRPLAKKMIENITSPGGAFIIGIFVTLFLLPCTIGPYLVVGNILSSLDWIKSFPWLILYNIIFVLPMLIVTLLVYFGMKRVEDVTGWKDKHIKLLHLVAGIVLVLLGLAMLIGWI